ncbi:chemotaxis-specific protein-glutamate methyltransferase CheB [Candidatus Methylomirabilis sp.]|uniref:chemotaxis-specific protein-glutamate methyltransferase CheB n=1 Tax=Candidatus Methylomirabilis sp. TaxID=2032687 RepID=UPI002A67537F|nr:chemotaxis-specific protein-glutamate methyltransferase CheB [Candidatus Methylomirabilis sp.]
MIRILVADDSATVREYLAFLLDQDPALQVVGKARDGLDALEQAERLKPDVIVMDVHMPRMNGYEATRQIMERVPTPIVMVSASSTRYEAATAFEALKAGALTVVEKPTGQDHPTQAESVRRLVQTVKLMAEVKVIRRWPRTRDWGSGVRDRGLISELPSPSPRPLAPGSQKIRLIAIGGSTGAPQVINDILARLPRELGAPILIVQHIAPGFTGGFADWLAQGTRLAVKLAESGEATRPGTVYLAPEGFQTGITTEGRIRLTRESAEEGFCPSASYLFQSVAEAYGRSAIGILMTGMGRDGAAGLKRLREAGGVTIAQDEESCVIFGMPQEAIRQGAVEHVLSPEQIVGAIRSLVNHG